MPPCSNGAVTHHSRGSYVAEKVSTNEYIVLISTAPINHSVTSAEMNAKTGYRDTLLGASSGHRIDVLGNDFERVGLELRGLAHRLFPLFIPNDDTEAEILDHLVVAKRCLSLRGQVIPHKDGVCRE